MALIASGLPEYLLASIPDAYPALEVFPADEAATLDDAELVDRVRSNGEVTTLGIRPVGAPRSSTSGLVATLAKHEMHGALQALTGIGAEILRISSNIPMVQVRIDAELIPHVRGLPFVDYISASEPIQFSGTRVLTTDLSLPMIGDSLDWGISRVRAPDVWGLTDGNSVVITALDTGHDYEHYFGWGYDISHYNMDGCYSYDLSPGCRDGTEATGDGTGHGSHVLGIASAPEDGSGVVGVAPGASRIMFDIANGLSPDAQAAAWALDWLRSNTSYPRHVVNMSFELTTSDQALSAAISDAHDAGYLLVAAVGNTQTASNTTVRFPATHTDVIAVSGTYDNGGNDKFAEYNHICRNGQLGSRYGSQVELAAPFDTHNLGNDGGLDTRCGTSFAAPHVSGVAALVWSAYPGLSHTALRSRLSSNAKDLGSSGWDSKYGHGLVDAYQALRPAVTGSGTLLEGESGTYSQQLGIGGLSYQWQWNTGSGWTNLGTSSTQGITAPGGVTHFDVRVYVSKGGSTLESRRFRVTVVEDSGCAPTQPLC